MTTMWHRVLLLAFLAGICQCKDRNVAVLLGSDTQNHFKRLLLHSLLPEVDENLNYDDHSFVVYQNKELLDGQLESPFIKPISIDFSQITVILATKGTEQMSLEELRLLNEILYQFNDGIALISLGAENVMTQTLIEQSVFCWASSRIRSDLEVGEHHVQLCNGIKASELSILESKMIPLHEHVEEIALPLMPQRRFWPSVFASAEPAVKSKHTDQPNARKERIYGKDKKKNSAETSQEVEEKKVKVEKKNAKTVKKETVKADKKATQKRQVQQEEAESVVESKDSDKKLDCKYRKSCYEGKPAPTEEELQRKYSSASKTEAKPEPKPSQTNKNLSEDDKKLECKYRTSCYKEKGIKLSESNEKKAHQHIITTKHAEVVHDHEAETLKTAAKKAIKDVERQEQYAKEHPADPNYESLLKDTNQKLKSKEDCKYRKSCYATGILTEETIRGIQQSQTAIPQSHSHVDVKELSEADKKLKCKYRKTCYETGDIDIDDKRFDRPPAYIPPEEKVHVNVVELSDDDKKLKCKYRKSCYETGDLDPETIKAEKVRPVEVHRPEEFHKLDVADKKLKCKYRKDCYESGVLPNLDVNHVTPTTETPTIAAPKGESRELKCKYRKSCYESGRLDVENKPERVVIYDEPVPTSKADLKLRCKYRPTCYQEMAKQAEEYEKLVHTGHDESSEEPEDDENESDVIVEEPEDDDEQDEEKGDDEDKKDNVVIEEVTEEEQTEEPEVTVIPGGSKKSKKYNVEPKKEDEKVEERPEHMKLKQKKPPVEPKVEEERPAKKDVERMRKNPDKRFVHKFKKVGNYEKLPKSEDDDEVEEPVEDVEEDVEVADEGTDEVADEVADEVVEEEDTEEEEEVAPTPAFVAITHEDDDEEEEAEAENVEQSEAEDEVEYEEIVRPENPLPCKYRKSCYRTGILDLDHVPVHTVTQKSSEKAVDVKELKEADRKLACKYRKHCYEDGVISEDHAAAKTTVHHTVVVDVKPKSEADRKLDCKYRKSCYGTSEETDDDEEDEQPDVEDVPTPKVVPVTETKHDEDDDDDDEDDHVKANGTVDPNSIPREARLMCKYRHSCYGNVEEVAKKDPQIAMKLHGEKCNTYWKSCREKLGLPVIERAPVDKEGRKLCRKKKAQ
ncbi:unnamed protein product [Bursaphelenchus okinawaensis]|uniref:Uncharacterized protein n=1 Tax=Bursaphelenchus okinawaensis TaxID=465554 RepID=A0A811KEM8_9BILA|nr:unnamed protein product [Bursaphelenchus okinawaensis]CAG9103267.1 unnamed protein product [Bursaphelenchus okinawaensis]